MTSEPVTYLSPQGTVGAGGGSARGGAIHHYPVVVGGGTPFLPPVAEHVALDLLETRTFGSRVTYERYGCARDQTDWHVVPAFRAGTTVSRSFSVLAALTVQVPGSWTT